MASTAIDRLDGLSSSTAIKGPCRLATTANITLSGEQTIDGVSAVTGDRVLVKDQTDTTTNGIYIVDTGPWRRSKDFYGARDVVTGTRVYVVAGSVGADTVWSVTTANPIVIGTSNIAFTAHNYQPLDADLTAIAALSTASFGRSVLTAANAAALATLAGVGTTDTPTFRGVAFPSTQVPSAGANTLDDYEEGTFTPAFSATGCTFNYAAQNGVYTKIGNLVSFNALVQLATSGNTLAANTLSMTGLPFAGRATEPATVRLLASWGQTTTSYVYVQAHLIAGATALTFQGLTAAGNNIAAASYLSADALLHATNGSNIRVIGSYHVD